MSLLQSIESGFQELLTGITAGEKALVADLKPILTGAVGQFLQTMLPTAESIVADLMTSGKTSNEKRDAAISQLQSAATTAGLSVATGVLNLGVEAAYNNVTAKIGSGTSSSSSSAGSVAASTASPAAPVAAAPALASIGESVPAPAGSDNTNGATQ